ncbi:MAG TPA: zinc-dependent alcohol dehydrogenase family protein [Ornithinimicrobium sp.]|uniref:zinc-dependent alcohol dehydrogenase family protein n=1 Tax=Ornithinimicrobium sp. TaxID=1977084 RepID=UPI002B484973|nr:zinc-dependent alcohol dehydrogenase family protein [Ornithinimicrobium sp.]HKJ13083.1 zinc-dependent alcohol dehydrogenase family protein [Ornithinimicrobium sp.]
MRAAVISAPGVVDVQDVPDPAPGPGEVVLQVAAEGVCGTDLHILGGDFAPRLPLVPGHEISGTVVAIGEDVGLVSVGDLVVVDPSLPCHACSACRRGRVNLCERFAAIGVTQAGGAAEYVLAPAQNCVALPPDTDPVLASLTEPVACAVHAFDSLPRRRAERYLLYGAGTMGLVMGRLAQRSGASTVRIVEPKAERRGVARSMQLDVSAPGDEAIHAEAHGYDVVIDCTGVVAAIADGLPRVAPGGTFLHLGVPPEGTRIDYDAHRVYRHEITITGTMSLQHSMDAAAQLLATGLLDAALLVTSRFALEDYPRALEAVRLGTGIKTVVLPSVSGG